MQTLTQIREILDQAGLAPQKAFGQNFLIDLNLLGKLVELADLRPDKTVLEVGPGTGSLTEELIARCGKVVAVEIDRGLGQMLADRFAGQGNFSLIGSDVLADKHHISPAVLDQLGPTAHLVSNLPYNIATPLLMECLLMSWRSRHTPEADPGSLVCFESLTFTVQREVADRLVAACDGGAYGPVSVLIGLLTNATLGSIVPASAFWPRPSVDSRIVRLDFDPQAAARLQDAGVLMNLLSLAFNQRRKQIGSILRRKESPFDASSLQGALAAAGIDPSLRPQQVEPGQFLAMSNALSAEE
jgi:16S rRNA (adenine1518-N6/adenine1519-N6)-dimethyltransferase